MTLATLVRHPRAPRRFVRADLDRVLDDFRNDLGFAPFVLPRRGHTAAFAPRFEAVELEDAYRVTAELPGVETADLHVEVQDGVLNVEGHRRLEGEAASEGEASRIDARGRFQRRFRFPGEIVDTDVKATYRNGILTVTVPKTAESKPEARSIPVETA